MSDETLPDEQVPLERFPLLADGDWLRAQYQDAGWSAATRRRSALIRRGPWLDSYPPLG